MDKEEKDAPEEILQDVKVVKGVMGDFDLSILDEEDKEIDHLIGEIDMETNGEQIPSSFAQIEKKDFPLFVTVKEFFYLLDSLVKPSFFERNTENSIRVGIGEDGRQAVYRYKKNASDNRLFDRILDREKFGKHMMKDNDERRDIPIDEDDSDSEDNAYTFSKTKMDNNETDKVIVNKLRLDTINHQEKNINLELYSVDLISEMGYEEFVELYWPHFLDQQKDWKVRDEWKKKNARYYWTNLQANQADHTLKYDYDAWKRKRGFFDTLDLMHHLNKFNIIKEAQKYLVNFLFIDEIQDISKPLLQFLCRFSTKCVYLSGDNAQSITKGHTINFRELASQLVFPHNYFDVGATYYPLSINYRSHQEILDIANNIIYHLRLFFPEHVEVLPPEESRSKGPKPIVVELGISADRFKEFYNEHMSSEKANEIKAFGTRQVFITRGQESKDIAESLFPDSLVFTIVEAKGMEFDDVILFNYFSDSKSRISWSAFQNCMNVSTYKTNRPIPLSITQNSVRYTREIDSADRSGFLEISLQKDRMHFEAWVEKWCEVGISEAADELKLLYVAVTRAKKRLLIYDDLRGMKPELHHRSYFDKVWRSLGMVTSTKNFKNLEAFQDNEEEKEASKSAQKRIIMDALYYMKTGLFAYAEKCFKRAECRRGEVVARLHKEARKIREEYFQTNTSRLLISAQNMESNEIDFNKQKEILLDRARQVSQDFMRIGSETWALQTLTIMGDLEGQIELLKRLGKKSALGEVLLIQNKIDEAIEAFIEDSNWEGAIVGICSKSDSKIIIKELKDLRDKIHPSFYRRVDRLCKENMKYVIRETNDRILNDHDEEINKERVPLEDIKNDQIMNEQTIKSSQNDKYESISDQQANEYLEKEERIKVQTSEESAVSKVESLESSFVNIEDGDQEIQDQFDQLERMSDSFIEISIENGVLKARSNASFSDFENIGSIKDNKDSFVDIVEEDQIKDVERVMNFKQERIASEFISVFSKVAQIFKPKHSEKSISPTKMIEIGMVEIEEDVLQRVIYLCEKMDCFGLSNLLEAFAGYKNSYFGHFCLKLISFAQVTLPFIKYDRRNSFKEKRSGNWERRWLSSVGFITVKSEFSGSRLAEGVRSKHMKERRDHVLTGMYGYIRQMISLYDRKHSIEILTAFGDIESLLVIFPEFIQPHSAGLSLLLTGNACLKLSFIYNTIVNRMVRRCSLINFGLYWLMQKSTYQPDPNVDSFSEFKGRNKSLQTLFRIAQYAIQGNENMINTEVLSLNLFKKIRENRLEDGFLLGFIFNLLFFKNDILHPNLVNDKEKLRYSKRSMRVVIPIIKGEKSLFNSNFYEGFLISFKISVVPVNIESLITHLLHGPYMIHRSSLLYPSECTLQRIDPSSTFFACPSISIDIEVPPPKKHQKFDISSFILQFENYDRYTLEKDKLKDRLEMILLDSDHNIKTVLKVKKEIEQLSLKYSQTYNKDTFALIAKLMDNRQHTRDMHTLYSSYTSLYSSIRHTQSTAHYSHILSSCILLHNICMSYRCLHLFRHTLSSLIKGTFSLT